VIVRSEGSLERRERVVGKVKVVVEGKSEVVVEGKCEREVVVEGKYLDLESFPFGTSPQRTQATVQVRRLSRKFIPVLLTVSV
jgi:hypothetical protein